MDREDEIRLTAYYMWESEARPEGKSLDYWTRAEHMWEDYNKRKAASSCTSKVAKKAPAKSAKK